MPALRPVALAVGHQIGARFDLDDFTLTFDRLFASDLSGRARAFQSMVKGGLPLEKAAALGPGLWRKRSNGRHREAGPAYHSPCENKNRKRPEWRADLRRAEGHRCVASRHDPRPGNEYEGTTIQSFNSVRYRVRAGSAWAVGDEIRDEDNVRRIVAGIAKSDHRGRYLDLYTTGPSPEHEE